MFVHGIGLDGRYLMPTGHHLVDTWPVYAPDLPGFGRSSSPHRVLDVTELADALGMWMQAIDLDRPVLVGNSFGCQVIVDLVARRPAAARALVLVAPTIDPAARSAAVQIARWVRDGRRERPSLALMLALGYLHCGARRVVGTFRHALNDRIDLKLPRLALPTLVVRGQHDPIVPQRWAQHAAALVAEGSLAVVPGAGHTVNYSAPAELAAVIRAFLRGRA